MTFGVDLAWGRPRISALENAGVKFVCRYLSHDTSGKNLDRAEAEGYSNAGIWVVVVWESTAQRSLSGFAGGADDARAAEAQAKACGMPDDRPIYFAVDFDASASDKPSIMHYLDGAASVLGKSRTGLYAGYRPVKWALDDGHCKWAWQTYAWSGGQWDSRAQLQQYSNDHIIDGVGLDYDRSVKEDYGQWKVGVTPTPSPPQPKNDPVEEDMPFGLLKEGPQAVTPIALPKGAYKTVGFTSDNGLQGKPPAKLRLAIHDDKGWHVDPDGVIVDSTKGQFVVKLTDTTDGLSVRREDLGDVAVAYEVS